jgi:uncharacterized protein YecA (UPF0149 family)
MSEVSEARRAYKRAWMARKRAAAREATEVVHVVVSRTLAAKLRALKPYGWGFGQFLGQWLRETLPNPPPIKDKRGLPAVPPAPVVSPVRVTTGPNDPCPCRSGRKWKKCCGR